MGSLVRWTETASMRNNKIVAAQKEYNNQGVF
jgi:hypothetical protein